MIRPDAGVMTPHCFFCDGLVAEQEARLTEYGKVYGPCCADLGSKRDR